MTSPYHWDLGSRAVLCYIKGPSATLDKLVLRTLASYANRDGLAWPMQTSLARELGVSERAVRGSIKRLEQDYGLIKKLLRGNQTRSNSYEMLFQPLAKLASHIGDRYRFEAPVISGLPGPTIGSPTVNRVVDEESGSNWEETGGTGTIVPVRTETDDWWSTGTAVPPEQPDAPEQLGGAPEQPGSRTGTTLPLSNRKNKKDISEIPEVTPFPQVDSVSENSREDTLGHSFDAPLGGGIPLISSMPPKVDSQERYHNHGELHEKREDAGCKLAPARLHQLPSIRIHGLTPEQSEAQMEAYMRRVKETGVTRLVAESEHREKRSPLQNAAGEAGHGSA